MMTMSGFAAPFSWPWYDAVRRMGPVERMIAAYFAFMIASMLCFGTMTLLSLLP